MILIISSFLITLLNTLATHTLLTRKKSILYSIVTFILNTLFFYCAAFLAKKYIHNTIILKYTLIFSAFLYIVYIHLIFKETITKKIFTMFSIWMTSIIAVFIATLATGVDVKYTQNIIYFFRICIQIILLFITYFWISKPYKEVLDIVPDKTLKLMSLYPLIAFLLLINNYEKSFEGFNDFNSIYNIILLLVFITLGYLLVYAGITSSSKIISLKYDLKIIENQVEAQYYMANFDSLTEIANRSNIMKQLDKTIEISNIDKQKFALMILDLDKFKRINDEYGHLIGDKALKYAAQILQKVLKNTDYVGRFGGDEFVIIQQFIKDESDVEMLINRIFEELKTPLIIGDTQILIKVSIGVSIFPEYTSQLEMLIHQADSAMYEAKKRDGCTFSFF